MKIKILISTILVILSFTINAQYISQILEFTPAPGQQVNSAPWGVPSSAESIIGGIEGTLNLGAFGGYVVFRFDEAVINDPANPFGIDFSIFGNPLPNFTEAAIVFVMQDENENGLADDTWYELAGSDHFYTTSLNNYSVTYQNPGTATDIPWTDNQGNEGFIEANTFHQQPYYPSTDSFPSVNPEAYTLSGSYITGKIDKSIPSNVKSFKRAFGYVDNNPRGVAPYTIPDNPYTIENENSGGDAFDISWAVDQNNNYIALDSIHFIKVQSAMQENAGWLGELSPEITGACIVYPDNTISGNHHLINLQELPDTIIANNYQLNAFFFEGGKYVPETQLDWTIDIASANISEEGILNSTENGLCTITVKAVDFPTQSASITCYVIAGSNSILSDNKSTLNIYPNPASTFVTIDGPENYNLNIYNTSGQLIKNFKNLHKKNRIDISEFPQGVLVL